MPTHPHFLWKDLFRRKANPRATVYEALRDNILFKTLTRKELRYLSNLVHERVYQPDEAIFKQGDRGIGMYIIAKGRVAMKTTSGQSELLVTTLNEGSFFGELALVAQDNIRTASAVALERVELIGFFKPDLMQIIQHRPALGVKILFQLSTVLGRRLHETTEKITLLAKARGVTQIHDEVV